MSQKLTSFAEKKEIVDNTEELKDYSDKMRIELMNKIAEKGGGNMNRQILFNGTDYLTKFTDINFTGLGTSFSVSDDNTNKRVDVEIISSGGEYDAGSVATTATINWNNGPVQYVTMTADTTFTFSNPLSGGRYLLHMAGAFTPTFPSTVRWPNNTTPTATVTSGRKDIYMFVYSGKESLYDGTVALNFVTT